VRPIALPSRRFLNEGFWVLAGQLLSAIGVLIGLRLLTTLLSPKAFGEVALAGGIVVLATGIAASPLMQGVLRYYPEASRTGNVFNLEHVVNYFLKRLIAVAAVVVFLAFNLFAFYEPTDLWLGPIMVLLLIVEAVRQKELTLLNASRCQRLSAAWNMLDAWGRPASAYLFALVLGATAEMTLAGSLIASTTLLLVFSPLATTARSQTNGQRRLEGHSDSSKRQEIERALLDYSRPLMPLGLVGWICSQADRYLICGLLTVEDAGLYAAVYGIVSRPFLMAGGTFESWIRPAYYDACEKMGSDSRRHHQIMVWWLTGISSVAVAGIIAFSLWHENIAHLLLAPEYRLASWLMPWIAFGYGLVLLAQVYERVCYVAGDTASVLRIEMLASIAALITTFYTLRVFGLPGAAYAVPVYFGVQLAAAVLFARKARAGTRQLLLVESRANA
jgi:O-antigen/teichoic acid export membrane protein